MYLNILGLVFPIDSGELTWQPELIEIPPLQREHVVNEDRS